MLDWVKLVLYDKLHLTLKLLPLGLTGLLSELIPY